MILNDKTFNLYAAKFYDNPHCYDQTEFDEDLKRFQYLKRLFNKYRETGEIKERLVLNHLIILFNVFPPPACTTMLFMKLNGYYEILKPFLIFLNMMPEKIVLDNENIHNSSIPLDLNIVKLLRTKDTRDEDH